MAQLSTEFVLRHVQSRFWGGSASHACPLDTSLNASRASKYIAHSCTPKSYDLHSRSYYL